VIAALTCARLAGSAQQLGMYLLDQARDHGVHLINARVTQVRQVKEHVESVLLDSGEALSTRFFVNAAGPFIKQVGYLLGVDLPVYCELHLKVAFKDMLRVLHARLLADLD
jgi:glycerol-3-phosphate dehydrogenase